MKNGFIKVGAAGTDVSVADVSHNASEIIKAVADAASKGVRLLILPELCLCGYTCGDLFLSDTLINACKTELCGVIEKTEQYDTVFVLGLPVKYNSKLYNCAAVVHRGALLGIVPKTYLPNYAEFYEQRYFCSGAELRGATLYNFLPDGMKGCSPPMSTNILFCCRNMPDFKFAVEICEDIWVPCPPSVSHCRAGATVIANLSASNEVIGKPEYRRLLVQSTSAKLCCGYIYADCLSSESTQNAIFSGHSLICEGGNILSENAPFEGKTLIMSEFDVETIASNRRKTNSYTERPAPEGEYAEIEFELEPCVTELTRKYSKTPFVPDDPEELKRRAELIFKMQAAALGKRAEHTGAKKLVVGLSGGLDSTLALLTAVNTADKIGLSRADILAVTLPCFGTTAHTRSNAETLAECFGVSFRTIDISASAALHLRDIGLPETDRSAAYENAQARERTQVLFDLANMYGGLLVGTGDLSELALGWCTYNGDHMSSYGVNSGIPKTLVRQLVKYAADCALEAGEKEKARVLYDVLATPVSPELLPPENGEIAQKTEQLIGPYELHDFFLYYTVRRGFAPSKIFRLAKYAFAGEYDDETILKWEKFFIRRFFTQQFKRSCLPDGIKIGTVSLSPRGDWRMPDDASAETWLSELNEKITIM